MAQNGVERSSAETAGQVMEQVNMLAEMAMSLGGNADFELVKQSREWASLSDEDKGKITDYAQGKGFANIEDQESETMEGDTQDFENESNPVVEKKAPVQPGKERRPLKRRFLGYGVTLDDKGELAFNEKMLERDADGGEQERVRGAGFSFPEDIAGRLNDDEKLRKLFAERLTELRNDLENNRGVKLFVDRPKDKPDQIIPKWKYRLVGKTQEDVFAVDELPDEVVGVIKAGGDYWQDREYRSWFGRSMQKKREEILAGAIMFELKKTEDEKQMNYGYGGSIETEANRESSATARSLRQAFVEGNGTIGEFGLRKGVKEVFSDFTELIHDQESADRYREVIEDFVWTGALAQARVAGLESPGVSRADVKRVVKEITEAYLANLERTSVISGGKTQLQTKAGREENISKLGGKVSKRARGSRVVTSVAVSLAGRGIEKQTTADVLRRVIETELAAAYDKDTVARTARQLSEYAEGKNPVAERFRRQVAGVERGKLVIRDYDLLVTAAKKFANELKKKH